MKKIVFALVLMFPLVSQAKTIKTSEVNWLPKLAEKNIREFHVCGNPQIQLNKKSLSKDFAFGFKQAGYLFSNLISFQQYISILSEKNSEEAKSALQAEFSRAHLWKYSKKTGFEDLGTVSKIDLRFSTTIKDCMEGAKTSLGNDCSKLTGDSRRGCCSEKFTGPALYWGNNEQFKLMYSPDPSVRLKVNKEKNHRYCNVQETVVIR